jgi:hypothetical protein
VAIRVSRFALVTATSPGLRPGARFPLVAVNANEKPSHRELRRRRTRGESVGLFPACEFE